MLRAAGAASFAANHATDLFNGSRREVGQATELEIAPEVLHGVQLGSIAGQKFDAPSRMVGQELPDLCVFVTLAAIPDEDGGAAHVPSQISKEGEQARPAEVFFGQQRQIPIEPAPFGRNHQSAGSRYLFKGTPPGADDGGASPSSPGLPYNRVHQESGLVLEDDARADATGFFLMRGHSSRTQRAISRSSRSLALRWGRCGVKPQRCSRRPT